MYVEQMGPVYKGTANSLGFFSRALKTIKGLYVWRVKIITSAILENNFKGKIKGM